MKSKLLIGSIVLVLAIAFVGVREYVRGTNATAKEDVPKSEKVVEVPNESAEPQPIHTEQDKEVGEWAAEASEILSEPLDDPRLKEANSDEGFEYYLKSQKAIVEFPMPYVEEGNAFEKDLETLFGLSSYIGHIQFVRTAHLDPNGQAKETTELSDQWKPTDEDMRQAFEYMKQIINDLDVAANHNGEGETFGVTHILNGDKVSDIEKFSGGE